MRVKCSTCLQAMTPNDYLEALACGHEVKSLGQYTVTVKGNQMIVSGPDIAQAQLIAKRLSTGAARLATLYGKQVLISTQPTIVPSTTVISPEAPAATNPNNKRKQRESDEANNNISTGHNNAENEEPLGKKAKAGNEDQATIARLEGEVNRLSRNIVKINGLKSKYKKGNEELLAKIGRLTKTNQFLSNKHRQCPKKVGKLDWEIKNLKAKVKLYEDRLSKVKSLVSI